MSDDPKAKILEFLKYARFAVQEAKAECEGWGSVKLGVLVWPNDGKKAGRVACRFDAPEFFEELATLLGAPPLTEEDILDCKAAQIVSMFGDR